MEKQTDKLRLILASGSPRRKQLLGYFNFPFEIITADIEEHSDHESPYDQACDISEQKGRAVLETLEDKSNCLIISSDTMVVLNNKIYGKPGNRDTAKEMLLELSGQTHEVITSVTFLDEKGIAFNFYDKTKVTFEKIDLDLLEDYLDTEDSLDKAGAYGIQGASLTFISRLEGSYSNVVGFPLNLIVSQLKEKGYWTKLK